MQIFRSVSDFRSSAPTVVTVGVFDGVHLGHLEMLNRLSAYAYENECETVVVTFEPHPKLVLPNQKELKLLHTLDEKLERFRLAGIDSVLVIPFTTEFAGISPRNFIKHVLVDIIKIKHVITGYDHFFGQDRKGDFDLLNQMGNEHGFTVDELPMISVVSQTVSSSSVRQILLEGNVEQAEKMLGYAYSISGEVVTGNKIGRNIGYPTANLKPNSIHKLIPAQGVYTSYIELEGKTWKGMTNIGFRPTLDAKNLTIETHIFDFDSDVYGKEITVSFVNRLREERRFSGLESLKKQLEMDKVEAYSLLAESCALNY